MKKAAINSSADSKGTTYLLEPIWWAGLLLMIGGEIGNTISFTLAPVFVVTPLGALTVLVSAYGAHYTLGEKMSTRGYIGMFTCILGTLLVVIYGPTERDVANFSEMQDMLARPAFTVYLLTVFIVIVATTLLDRLYSIGEEFLLVYVGMCATVGSIVIMAIKVLGMAMGETLKGSNQFELTWENRAMFFTVACLLYALVSQLYYMNRALQVWFVDCRNKKMNPHTLCLSVLLGGRRG
jgi:magnesium transporter